METNEGFFTRVYEVVRMIPRGRVTSYGAIARYLGSAGAARMVGWALNQSHTSREFIPAHRVVNRNGMLTGKHHFDGTNLMQELLENEGALIEDLCILNFRELFWDPMEELGET
jgi:methylated-DNA-protein-cysteine methyltransferase-like protein